MKQNINERHAAEAPAAERADNVLRFVTRAELDRRAQRANRATRSAARAHDDDDPSPPAA